MKTVKLQTNLDWFKRMMFNALLPISILLAVLFLLSPSLLNYPWIYDKVDSFFEPLNNTEYKGAFIGACGGMIGSFLAITGALWVERQLAKDNERKEIEKIALILYYDMTLFYQEVTPLATNIAYILGIPESGLKEKKYINYKNQIGVHIHPDWIGLVASLKDNLSQTEIKQIYTFYGCVSDMKNKIEATYLESGNMGRVNHIINELGSKDGDEYIPNNNYQFIINKLKRIAKYETSSPIDNLD